MLVLKCKSCGSFDLEKNEDIFICQYCGTKHILDESLFRCARNDE